MFAYLSFPAGNDADSSNLVEYAAAEKVMIIPGYLSSVAHLQAAAVQLRQQQQHLHQEQPQQKQQEEGSAVMNRCPYFRVSFASVQSVEAIKEGFARLGEALRKCQGSS